MGPAPLNFGGRKKGAHANLRTLDKISDRNSEKTSSAKKLFTLLDLCVSSLRRGHANLLCIVPILTDDPRRESKNITSAFYPCCDLISSLMKLACNCWNHPYQAEWCHRRMCNCYRRDRIKAQKRLNLIWSRKWTHWDLNPGPSACEADVIPLHHVPSYQIITF